MKAIVLIPAAGTGRRMGGAVSKQYLDLAGRPILAHTLSRFENHPLIEHVFLIVPEDDITYCQHHIIQRYNFTKVRRLVSGGTTRQESVYNGIKALAEEQLDQPERPVLVHDGARPLFAVEQLEPLLEAIAAQGAAIIGVPVKDTIKEVDGGQIIGSPQRSRLWQAQTPQGAHYRLLNKAFRQALEDGFSGTDEASLLERIGTTVRMIEGDYRNIKVTTREDLLVAAAFLEHEQGGPT